MPIGPNWTEPWSGLFFSCSCPHLGSLQLPVASFWKYSKTGLFKLYRKYNICTETYMDSNKKVPILTIYIIILVFMCRGRSPGEKVVIWWCLYTLWLCMDHVVMFEFSKTKVAPFAWWLPTATTTTSTMPHHHSFHTNDYEPTNTTQAVQMMPVCHLGRVCLFNSFIITSTKSFLLSFRFYLFC